MTDQLPRAIDAERYIVGCLVAFPERADEVFTRLTATDFIDPAHQKIVAAAQQQFAAGGIDPVLLGRETQSAGVLFECGIDPQNAPSTTAHIASEAAKIVEARRKRQLWQIAEDARHAAANGSTFDSAFRALTADLEDLARGNERCVKLRKASTVESKAIDWAWPGYLHRGGLTLLDGDPERGKSQISCHVTGCWTYPRPFPYAQHDHFREAGNVLMFATEDGEDTTIRPRLEAAGARLERVHFWPDDVDPVTLPSGIDLLSATVKEHGIGLLILDPLGVHLDEGINANRDADVRRALRPLVKLAQETNMAVLAVRHLNKDENKSALYRGGGSIAFTAAARVVWAVGTDPSDPKKLILAVLKSNIGPKPPALTYTIEGIGNTSRIKWEGESACTVADIFNRKQQRGGKTSDAKALLQQLLANGPMPEAEVWEEFQNAGFGQWPYRQARKLLRVESSKGSMREGWLLSLPEGAGFAEDAGEHAVTK